MHETAIRLLMLSAQGEGMDCSRSPASLLLCTISVWLSSGTCLGGIKPVTQSRWAEQAKWTLKHWALKTTKKSYAPQKYGHVLLSGVWGKVCEGDFHGIISACLPTYHPSSSPSHPLTPSRETPLRTCSADWVMGILGNEQRHLCSFPW